MSSRHLITRVWKHLNFKSIQKNAINSHILSCDFCLNVKSYLNNFSILDNCKLEFHAKIHKALLIKRKLNPNLNRQLYANAVVFNQGSASTVQGFRKFTFKTRV